MAASVKRYWISGAAGALGEAVVRAFRRAGHHLVLIDRPGVGLDQRAAPGERVFELNLLDPAACRDLAAQARQDDEWPDGLIHLVGGYRWGAAGEAEPAALDAMLDLNLRTLVNLASPWLGPFRERGQGWIAAVGSAQAWTGGAPHVAAYAASKAAMITWLRSVDQEMSGSDVSTTLLVPMGIIDTAANRAALPDLDPATFLDPEALAEALLMASATGPRGRLRELPVSGRR